MKFRLCLAVALAGSCVHGATPNSDLADAAMRGDKAAVRSLIQRKADVNAPQIDGTTALHWAVQANDLELADLLIRSGAKVSVATVAGATPLQLAAVNGSAAMLDRLVAAGADPNAPLTLSLI